ncbi:serine/threonine protein kinase [Sulfidibacter corallicola]|uniref:non-specific serine/threonine protein kinase n=1 Tax=Sulfidibacter corallicola TaxID=2818388 RepID=A0A8A4TU91_SULCO|nr:serine/threonine-protein kinase [Sulfidibacter corallicola]QTD53043.1 serine/threonine protein kinase [Sulfidibacter corallicola]
MTKSLGKYELLEVLGRGSMGVVYKALDPRIGKLAAIKTMNQKILGNPDLQERFFREGAILGQLQHRNIINVYNVGADGDNYYIAMEYLEGISLDKLVKKEGRLKPVRALELVKQVCDGVYAAHKQSIIHRDIKPANIFITGDDYVKVLDFGVASFQNSQLTNSGVLLGTINYMAPEQITGVKVDYRSDIFSIGVILYELLSGTNPFLGRNISQTMVRLVNENPKPIPAIPRRLQHILDQALEKERERRYRSCKLMASDIEMVLRSEELDEIPYELEDEESRENLLQKMIGLRIDVIKSAIKNEDFEQAEELIGQLKRVDRGKENARELTHMLERARRAHQEKALFVEQLTQETLAKANEHMSSRHYVAAIELCDKVLKMKPGHLDARVIRATSLTKLERFVEEARKRMPRNEKPSV